MKLLGSILAAIIVLLLLAASAMLMYYGYYLSEALITGAKQLKPEVYVPLTVTVITATLGLSATLYTQRKTRIREIEAAHRDRKLEIYLEFLKFIETAILSEKPELGGEPLNENDLARKLLEFRTKAVLWGSPGVLKGVAKLTSRNAGGPLEIFETLEAIQREMRKDIGLSNWGLEKDFFAKLPLSDPSEFEKMRENATQTTS